MFLLFKNQLHNVICCKFVTFVRLLLLLLPLLSYHFCFSKVKLKYFLLTLFPYLCSVVQGGPRKAYELYDAVIIENKNKFVLTTSMFKHCIPLSYQCSHNSHVMSKLDTSSG